MCPASGAGAEIERRDFIAARDAPDVFTGELHFENGIPTAVQNAALSRSDVGGIACHDGRRHRNVRYGRLPDHAAVTYVERYDFVRERREEQRIADQRKTAVNLRFGVVRPVLR